jgi:FixJ family two-component response regulator
MMPQLTQTLEHAARPQRSIEEARELLESLRAAYQSLSIAERGAVKGMIRRAQTKQLMQELDEERECFESVS